MKIEIDAEEVLRKKTKPYGKGGCHITMPKKHLNKKVVVVIEKNNDDELVDSNGSWLGGYVKKYGKPPETKQKKTKIKRR